MSGAHSTGKCMPGMDDFGSWNVVFPKKVRQRGTKLTVCAKIMPKVMQGNGLIFFKGYKDGLQPESLADGNWLVKQNQPVSKIETKSDTNLRRILYES